MWMGKILGFLIGLSAGGPMGAIIGVILGHFFDRSRSHIYRDFDPTRRAHIEETFFKTVYSLLGYLAKADGHVSEAEINGTEQLMARMKLTAGEREKAVTLFKEGTAPDFNAMALLSDFNQACGRYINLKQILLVYLISLALADGELKEPEKHVLEKIAEALGYSAIAFNQLLRMAMAQSHFYRYGQHEGFEPNRDGRHRHYKPPPPKDELVIAYQALGANASASDTELKKTYRQLISQYHPDKLMGRGVPDDMIEVATDRAQEIQAAYDLIKKSRNIR